jgi:CHAT domain-containing protein
METDLARYQYLHFATHGILPTDTGVREPALVLSFDGTAPEQMLLSMTDILRLRIRADSVVLSACNTGSGTVSRAEGVMSLGRAFLAAGASSVTVSLWQVSDESTARFMQEYYRRLSSGQRKDQALASARLWLISNGNKDPFYWAPFILIGE